MFIIFYIAIFSHMNQLLVLELNPKFGDPGSFG